MKKYFSLAVLAILAFALNANAQSPLVATLNHDGEIKVFYGSHAFVNAHAAAVHGDAITLSSGSLMSADITKAVSIHGAGMTTDSVTNMEPTILMDDFSIVVPDTTSHRLLMEGIYHNGRISLGFSRNAQILKCRLNRVSYENSATGTHQHPQDITFTHCRIATDLVMYKYSSASFLNCVIASVVQYGGSDIPFSFANCYVGNQNCAYSEYRNCVIYANTDISSNNFIGGGNSVYNNNILITNSGYGHLGVDYYNKTIKKENAGDLASGYSDLRSYALPDNVKNLIKGTDGTEVGIYGGSFPYDPTPSNPQITKFSVDKKSTADGKLNVVVEINGAK